MNWSIRSRRTPRDAVACMLQRVRARRAVCWLFSTPLEPPSTRLVRVATVASAPARSTPGRTIFLATLFLVRPRSHGRLVNENLVPIPRDTKPPARRVPVPLLRSVHKSYWFHPITSGRWWSSTPAAKVNGDIAVTWIALRCVSNSRCVARGLPRGNGNRLVMDCWPVKLSSMGTWCCYRSSCFTYKSGLCVCWYNANSLLAEFVNILYYNNEIRFLGDLSGLLKYCNAKIFMNYVENNKWTFRNSREC